MKGTYSACLVAAWNRLLILRCICGCISEAVLWPLIRDSPFIYYLLAELRHTLYNTSCTLFKSCSNLETFWSLSPQSFSEAQSAAPTAPECLQPDYSLLTSRRNRSCLTALGTEGRKKKDIQLHTTLTAVWLSLKPRAQGRPPSRSTVDAPSPLKALFGLAFFCKKLGVQHTYHNRFQRGGESALVNYRVITMFSLPILILKNRGNCYGQ